MLSKSCNISEDDFLYVVEDDIIILIFETYKTILCTKNNGTKRVNNSTYHYIGFPPQGLLMKGVILDDKYLYSMTYNKGNLKPCVFRRDYIDKVEESTSKSCYQIVDQTYYKYDITMKDGNKYQIIMNSKEVGEIYNPIQRMLFGEN